MVSKISKIIFVAVALSFPLSSFAAFSVPFQATSTTQGWAFPTRVNGTEQTVVAQNFIATSTSVSSRFPLASTTALTISGNSYLGTVSSGVWNGTAVAGGFGGTGQSSYSVGDILYASGATTLSKLNIGSSGDVLTVNGGIPIWLPPSSGTGNWATSSEQYYWSLFRDLSVQGNGYLAPTTTRGFIFTASSTASNLTVTNGTTTYATSTNIYSSGQTVLSATSGNTGIGTTTPAVKLAVVGDVLFANSVSNSPSLYMQNYGSGGRNWRFIASQTGDTLNGGFGLFDVTAGAYRFAIDANGNLGISTTSPWGKLSVTNTGTGPSFIVEDAASPDSSPFIVDSAGNVGIGNPTPTTALSVAGSGSTISGTISAIAEFKNTTTGGGVAKGPFLGYDSGSNTSVIGATIAGGATNNLAFWSYNGSAWGERMRMTSGGNLGISTTSPFALLSVAGDAYIGGNLTATGTVTFTGVSTGCLQSTSGVISSTGSACGSGGGSWATSSEQYYWSQFRDWNVNSFGALAPTTTRGIFVNASSTIGNGVQAGGLTVYGGATTTGNLVVTGRAIIGNTSHGDQLEVGGNIYSTNSMQAASNVISDGGSLGSAGFKFSNDFASGLYSPSAGVVGITSGSIEIMRATGSRRVGIATTSPFTTLSVGGGAYIGGNLTATGTASVASLAVTSQSSGCAQFDSSGNLTSTGSSCGSGGGGATFGQGWEINGNGYLAPTTTIDVYIPQSLVFPSTNPTTKIYFDSGATPNDNLSIDMSGIKAFFLTANGLGTVSSGLTNPSLFPIADPTTGFGLFNNFPSLIASNNYIAHAETTGFTVDTGNLTLNASGNLVLSGLSDGCLSTASGVVTSSGSPCGGSSSPNTDKWATSSDGFSIQPNSGQPVLIPASTLSIGSSSPFLAALTIESGNSSTTPVTITGDVNSFFEGNMQNRSSGNNASTQWTVTSDKGVLGGFSKYYGEWGINNSGYSQAAFSSQNALDVFLNASDNGLVISTASSTNPDAEIRFATGGTSSSTIRMVIKQNGKIGIATTTPQHDLDVIGRISGQPSFFCSVPMMTQTNVVADQLGSATVAPFTCDSNMYLDVNATSNNGLLALSAANELSASGTPQMQIYDASIASSATDQFSMMKGLLAGSATSSLGKGIAMKSDIQTPKVGTTATTATTSVNYIPVGFTDVVVTSLTTSRSYTNPTNGCIVTASTTPNYKLVCFKAGNVTTVDTGFATSTTPFSVLLTMDSTGANVYFNNTASSSGTVSASNIPVTSLRPIQGVSVNLTGVTLTRAQMRAGNIQVWNQFNR